MAPSRSPEQEISLAAYRHQVDAYGSAHPFALDALVRHLLVAGWEGVIALGFDPTAGDLRIQAGIGCLRLTPTEREWAPGITPPLITAPPPRPAPPGMASARQRTCAACSAWDGGRCTVAGCGCAGLGQPSNLLSKCPRGLWLVA